MNDTPIPPAPEGGDAEDEKAPVSMRTIGNSGIEHLATRAAVIRKGNDIHDEVRRFIQSLLERVMYFATLRVNHRNAVTITEEDIRFAFRTQGVNYLFYRYKKSKKAKKQSSPSTGDDAPVASSSTQN